MHVSLCPMSDPCAPMRETDVNRPDTEVGMLATVVVLKIDVEINQQQSSLI